VEALRLVQRDSDLLYRKVDPDQWDHATGKLFPTAFEDPGKPYTRLSFYVKRCVSSAEAVLARFAKFGATKRACGTTGKPTTRRMFEVGYRIAALRASVIHDLGLEFETVDGHEISEDGHTNVLGGQQYAILLFSEASLLDDTETFGPPPETFGPPP
jgi:hypothetical protein